MLLPSHGDPITSVPFLYFFKNVWKNEVDKLYFRVNSAVGISVVNFLKEIVENNGGVFSYNNTSDGQHCVALTHLFNDSNEDIVVFMEEDGLVFKSGSINMYCDKIEKNMWKGGQPQRGLEGVISLYVIEKKTVLCCGYDNCLIYNLIKLDKNNIGGNNGSYKSICCWCL